MNRKTILALLLVLALFIVGGCSSNDATTSESTPTDAATEALTAEPTEEPTAEPTEEPTEEPTAEPTEEPTAEPTEEPNEAPADEPAEAAAQARAVTGEATDGEAMSEETEQNPVLASAYDGAVTVRAEDVRELYDQMLTAYVQYYAQYGYAMDEYDTELQATVASEIVQMELTNRVAIHHAERQGHALTPEREAEIAAEAEETLAGMREYVESYLSYYGYEGEELAALTEEQLLAAGYDLDTLVEDAKLQEIVNFLYALATADVTVTEEEVKAAYDAKVAEQKESYADPDAFINDYLGGADILYTPENMRLMHCIYVALDEAEETATPDEAETADETETTDEEAATPEEAQSEDIGALTGLAKAEAIVAAVRGGMDFDEAMLAYNEDTSTQENMMLGYPVSTEGGEMYSEAFLSAAVALENPGDVSDVVVTDYGYFILRYEHDLTAGEADFEARKEAETEEALTAKQDEAFSAYVDAMVTEANIEMGNLSPLYHVFVSESVEATEAYATIAEATDLLDMPNGDAVATLAVGASLDVLGRIGIDGEEYVFVAVPGTAFKGYVNAKVMADAQKDDALAVDNTALATAAEVEAKLPTFTIVMNDGSLIYGELYPDVAPETVGNFVALANEGFYNDLIFHRVVPGFVIQGGDPNGDGTGGPGYAIRGEFSSNGVQNDLSHTRGVLSMARSTAPDSAGSQFFIMHADNDYLDGDYAGFGLVLGGMETVDLIASVPTNSNDKPSVDQTMREVYVETYGQTYAFSKLED